MKLLWDLLEGKHIPFLSILFLECLISGFEALIHPLLLKIIFDEAIIVGNFNNFIILGSVYFLVGLVLNISGYYISLWRKMFENNCLISLETRLLTKTMLLDSKEIQKNGEASYVSRIHNDSIEGVLSSFELIIDVSSRAIASIAFIGVLLYISWQASIILLIIVPILMIISNHIGQQVKDNTEPEREAEARFIDVLTKTLKSFFAIRGISRLRSMITPVNQKSLQKYLNLSYKNYKLKAKQEAWSDIIMNISDASSMIVGAYFVFLGQISFGGFLAFVNSLWRAVSGIFSILDMIPDFYRNMEIINRLSRLYNYEQNIYYKNNPTLSTEDIIINFNNQTSIEYDNLNIKSGQKILIQGPNGSGKSTLLNIVSGILKPDQGTITIPKQIAILTCPVNLPPLPINNLISDQSLLMALELFEHQQKTPEYLSSGQRQKLGIALVLSEEADLYILDEPLANLDVKNKEHMLQFILDRIGKKSLIVVHHGDDINRSIFDQTIILPAKSLMKGHLPESPETINVSKNSIDPS